MRVTSQLVEYFHLDPAYALLTIQNLVSVMECFNLLDIHERSSLNDVIFYTYMRQSTDLRTKDMDVVFQLLDVDQSGDMEFDEFYLLFCVMVACKDQYEKEFIYRHSQSIFELIDADNSGQISGDEFANMGILFNFDRKSVMTIFNEFDVSGDKSLDFSEFRLFTMACIDEQRIADAHAKVAAYRNYHHRLINSLTPHLKRYIQSRRIPPPIEIESAVEETPPPFLVRIFQKRNILHKIANAWYCFQWWLVDQMISLATCFTRCQQNRRRRKHHAMVQRHQSMYIHQEPKPGCCGRVESHEDIAENSDEKELLDEEEERRARKCCGKRKRCFPQNYKTFKAFQRNQFQSSADSQISTFTVRQFD